jgi:ABC-2 type transport system permease protein
VITVLPSLVRKTLRDWRRAAIGWGIGLTAFALTYLGFWASVKNSPALLELKTETLPEAVKATLGVADLTTGLGYLQGTIYSLIGPLLLCMAAIIFGARAIAGPEDHHVMDLFLANPISRHGFVAQRTGVVFAVVGALGLILWIVPVVMSQALEMGVSIANVSAASVGLLLLGLFFAALALGVGAATGRRSTALGVAGAVAVAGYVVRGIADSVPEVSWWRWLSPFHYYIGSDPLHNGFNLGYLLVLAVASAVFVAVALVSFDRRDVRV